MCSDLAGRWTLDEDRVSFYRVRRYLSRACCAADLRLPYVSRRLAHTKLKPPSTVG